MKVFEYLDRISMMHKMVSREKTGTPEELARRLGLSVAGVGFSVRRGESIARERSLRLMED